MQVFLYTAQSVPTAWHSCLSSVSCISTYLTVTKQASSCLHHICCQPRSCSNGLKLSTVKTYSIMHTVVIAEDGHRQQSALMQQCPMPPAQQLSSASELAALGDQLLLGHQKQPRLETALGAVCLFCKVPGWPLVSLVVACHV